jgi:signal transduction histidine kinase
MMQDMGILRAARNWSGPPLALQIVGLLLGGLVVSQLVTLFLTLVLPPAPQPQYGLNEIARALSGASLQSGKGHPLQRVVRLGPPSMTGSNWLTSDRSRHDLAVLLGREETDVQLHFFTPLPFAGIAHSERSELLREFERRAELPRFTRAQFQMAQNAATTGAFPGGGFPGGFPGGGYPGGNVLRPTVTPAPVTPPVVIQNLPMPSTMNTAAPPVVVPNVTPNTVMPNAALPGGILPNVVMRTTLPSAATVQIPAVTQPVLPNVIQNGLASVMSARPVMPPAPPLISVPALGGPSSLRVPVVPPVVTPTAPRTEPPRVVSVEPPRPRVPVTLAPEVAPPSVPRPQTVTPSLPVPEPAPVMRETLPPAETPAASIPVPRGLFGLAPAPFVIGDFVAAMRLDDGRWAVVQPAPEPFPNTWQRRVLLWFLISFALVAPLGWLFARRLVRPIAGFAHAAEQLGRDPTAHIMPLEGPAEVGRAAHAFNRMQSRLRSFVDDRTAMVGAISHDLRTPLTRLRFRLEDVPDEMREPMLAEVDEMEQMISSVLAFIRDASEPGSRETLDLRSIVEDVVEDAVFVGKSVTLGETEHATVEVDPLGMRRLLGNLVENAVKYGDRAQVRLFTDRQDAVAEIRDNGPGLPDEELERVFQPFYRAPAARASNKHGTGLGLAVCRSIARAHGGDVRLQRGERGLVAQVRLPLAYGMPAS